MRLILALITSLLAPAVVAGELAKRPGWEMFHSAKTYDELLVDVRSAVKSSDLIVVTQAGPTKAAAARGIQIPGNRVIGVFNNDYAVRILDLSVAAMIEAPIRLYVTETSAGRADLSYKRPSHAFAPYVNEGGSELLRIAHELDQKFLAIALQAVNAQH